MMPFSQEPIAGYLDAGTVVTPDEKYMSINTLETASYY